MGKRQVRQTVFSWSTCSWRTHQSGRYSNERGRRRRRRSALAFIACHFPGPLSPTCRATCPKVSTLLFPCFSCKTVDEGAFYASAGSHAQQQPRGNLSITRRPHHSEYSRRTFRAMANTGSTGAATAAGGGSDGACGGGTDTPLFVYGTLMNEKASGPTPGKHASIRGLRPRVQAGNETVATCRHAPPPRPAAEI